jgi:hypothetical protein
MRSYRNASEAVHEQGGAAYADVSRRPACPQYIHSAALAELYNSDGTGTAKPFCAARQLSPASTVSSERGVWHALHLSGSVQAANIRKPCESERKVRRSVMTVSHNGTQGSFGLVVMQKRDRETDRERERDRERETDRRRERETDRRRESVALDACPTLEPAGLPEKHRLISFNSLELQGKITDFRRIPSTYSETPSIPI